MKENPSHLRRSQWEVFDRCYAILLRLLRAPASSDELLHIVLDKSEEDGESLPLSKAKRRFEEDRRRLRDWFHCEIEYDRRDDLYILVSSDRALFDLTADGLRGLVFLQSTFSNANAVMGGEVRALLECLTRLLPAERRRDLVRERNLLGLDLQPRDQDEISSEVWNAIEIACKEHRQLEFEYFSPKQIDGQARTHLVEPLRHFFDPVRSHYYLEVFWIESNGPKGKHFYNLVQPFRMGRIDNPRVLPKHFVPGSRSIPKHELVYELAAEVARTGVTEHFPNSQIISQPDGSAIVHTLSSNLFFDLRTLLHYGANCRVIGGEEAVKQMKLIIGKMYQRYQEK